MLRLDQVDEAACALVGLLAGDLRLRLLLSVEEPPSESESIA